MSVMEQKPPRPKRTFTDEFKRDAVAMVLDDGNRIIDVAERVGIGEGTLGNWVGGLKGWSQDPRSGGGAEEGLGP